MNMPSAPAWTLKGARTSYNQFDGTHFDPNPGPSYNLSGMGIKTRSISFTTGKSIRPNINQGASRYPGPADYNPQLHSQSNTSIVFTKNSNLRRVDDDHPDPHTYSYNPNFTKQNIPRYSMGYKYQSSIYDLNKNPGPGHYNSHESEKNDMRSTKRSNFGGHPRFSEPNLKIPGPGDYNISTGFTSYKGTLSKSRKSLDMKNNVPGPGQYTQSDCFGYYNVGKTIGERAKGDFKTNLDTQNAFINYFKEPKQLKNKSYSVGKQPRQVFKMQNVPGPGDYQPSPSITFRNTNTVSFAKSSRRPVQSGNPGPGSYNPKQFNTTRHTISKSKSVDQLNKNPGVGRYNTEGNYQYCRQASGNVIGKSKRANFISKNIAGVGDYNLIQLKTGGVTIPRAERFHKNNTNPGPGAYYMHSTISNFNMYNKKS